MAGNIKRAAIVAAAVALLTPAALTSTARAAESSACFFDRPDFEGAAFCTSSGTRAGREQGELAVSNNKAPKTTTVVRRLCAAPAQAVSKASWP